MEHVLKSSIITAGLWQLAREMASLAINTLIYICCIILQLLLCHLLSFLDQHSLFTLDCLFRHRISNVVHLVHLLRTTTFMCRAVSAVSVTLRLGLLLFLPPWQSHNSGEVGQKILLVLFLHLLVWPVAITDVWPLFCTMISQKALQ